MSIFSGIFGSKEDKTTYESNLKINWIPLTDLSQLDEIKEISKTESVLIFKHSTRCGISTMVIKQFEKLFKEEHQQLKVYYLDLLNYRNVSDEVGFMFQVMHQSPQLFVIKNEVSVFNASHSDIIQTNLTRFV